MRTMCNKTCRTWYLNSSIYAGEAQLLIKNLPNLLSMKNSIIQDQSCTSLKWVNFAS